ncbi:MAG: hypothetical protein K0S61_3984 [Anaerocolumna sp.]|nr:hypothetical protein [Anaerocolumna sp.]
MPIAPGPECAPILGLIEFTITDLLGNFSFIKPTTYSASSRSSPCNTQITSSSSLYLP